MKKITILSLALLVLSVVLAVVSLIILPDSVIIQFSAASTDRTTAPKLLAVLIPSVLGIGGSLFTLFSKNDSKESSRSLIISVVGIIVFAIMITANLIIK